VLWVTAGAGRLSQAPFAPTDGAEHRPLVADADGATRGWRCAQGLPHGDRRLGKASLISMALMLLEKLENLPLRCLPQPTVSG
jgi:hypothetical protein